MTPSEEERAFLASYDPRAYPPVAVTVDVVLTTIRSGQLCVLLVERANWPHKGAWALPGGFIEPDETLDAAAARELAEETGIAIGDGPGQQGHVEQLRSYGDPGRDPRVRTVTVAYVGLMPDLPTPVADSDASNARFWPVADLDLGQRRRGRRRDLLPLAFDHQQVVLDGVERIRSKLEYTTLATEFLEEPFTITELRRVYETVWGVELDPANFSRKVLATPGFVVPTGALGESSPSGGRRPELYRRGDATTLTPPLLRG